MGKRRDRGTEKNIRLWRVFMRLKEQEDSDNSSKK